MSLDVTLSDLDLPLPGPHGWEGPAWSLALALWTLRARDVATGASVGTAVVDAADRGVYQLGGAAGEDGTLALHALPGAALLDELVRLVIDPARTWSAREEQEV